LSFPGRHVVMRLLVFFLLAAPLFAVAQTLQPWREGRLPPFELDALDGVRHRLADYRGKVVLVNFWASWCAPCRAEMPSLQALADSLKREPFVVLAVNVGESPEAMREFVKRMPLRFTLLVDPGATTARAWGARALPTTFVLDPEGRPRYRHVGDLDWAQPAVRNRIRALMTLRPLESAAAVHGAARRHQAATLARR
ncbi:MAG: TlpA disulfide reductase family protein, partial [Proteobacteria bacterium]|nr:TlpA disulfide reductase family protein [Pseudomonadota bacterium]